VFSQKHRIGCHVVIVFFVLAGSALAQTPPESDRARKAALRMLHQREIPEATLPCTPEEGKWWQDLRKAAKAVQDTRGGRKEKKKFLRLLQEGQARSYQPPIPDRGALVLSKLPPNYSEAARRKQKKGSIALVVELRADGFVGEVQVVQGLDRDLDENAIEAARRTVFLPRVKDRKFVRFMLPVTMSFDTN
jgi:TonB family protein